MCNSTFLLATLMVRGNTRCLSGGSGLVDGKEGGGNSSPAHAIVLDAEGFSWSLSGGGEGKNRAMLCEPDFGGYIRKRKLAGLFGSLVMNSEPLWGFSGPYPGRHMSLQAII